MKSVFICTIFSFNTSLKNVNIQCVENCEENFKFKVLKKCDVSMEDCRNGECVELLLVMCAGRTTEVLYKDCS